MLLYQDKGKYALIVKPTLRTRKGGITRIATITIF